MLMCSVVILATWPCSAAAQDVIEPDRPDLTNGSHLVGTGVVQFEVGAIYTRRSDEGHTLGSPLTVRIGVSDWFEARAGFDGLLHAADADGTTATGLGNIQVAAKIRLLREADGRARMSVSPQINVPTASADKRLGSGELDVVVTELAGLDLGQVARIDINYAIGSVGGGRGEARFAQQFMSASLSASTGHWSPYLEVFRISRDRPDGTPIVSMNTGVLYAIAPRLVVDGGVIFGLSADAPPFAVVGGLSTAIGGLHTHTPSEARGLLTSISAFPGRD
jgi:hypothetical protein